MFKALIVSMAVLHGADAASTCVALHRGFVETNPIFGAHATCGRVIAGKIVFVGLGTAAALTLHRTHPKLATAIASIGVTSGGIGFTVNLVRLKG